GLLAMIVLFLFLRNLGATLIVSISIPVSVVATFTMMFGADLTLNVMSLGGLALGIGLLVDNSIVVLENIARHRAMGKSKFDAARDGASEVGGAVVASTLTTVAVFLPLVFVTGIAGQLFRDQALTVTFSLLASLAVALTLIPTLAAGRGRGGRHEEEDVVPAEKGDGWKTAVGVRAPAGIIKVFGILFGAIGRILGFVLKPVFWLFEKGYGAIERIYPRLLDGALQRRAVVIGLAVVLFVGTLAMTRYLGAELIPQLAQGEFEVELELPPGTPLSDTDLVIRRAQQTAAALESVETSFGVAGSGNRLDANPEKGGENWGELNVQLIAGSGEQAEAEAVARLRDAFSKIPGLEYRFGRPALFSIETPIEVEVAGFDLNELKLVSAAIASRMTQSPRFADVKTTVEQGQPELQIRFDRERAAILGEPVNVIAERVVDHVRGEVATQYSWRDRKIDVLVRAQPEDRASVERLRQLIVNPTSARPVPLEAVADITIENGPGEIRRINQERVALVRANLGFGDLGGAAEELQGIIDEVRTPPGTVARLGGQNAEMAGSFRSLMFALLLAVFLVYLVMASQFESFIHPLVILFSVPLALIGAVWGLFVTGSTVSVVVFIGLILLAGIVVNNAIVLIDLINSLRAEGMERGEAIREAGRLRLRPILMTTLTTVLGLLPLALGVGEGAEVRAPMAVTVIGGLVVSTALTLVVIPVVYDVLDRFALVKSR
ncbi:MAG: efflux RND transporter permease subunit, partial [Bacteroidota bacterium]